MTLQRSFESIIHELRQWRRSLRGYQVNAYSQEGEDLILLRLLGGRKSGFYVDVGAHHPQRFSNTYLFYQRGWHGINIDALPGSMSSFKRLRKRDINLELAIAGEPGSLTYYIFNDGALNTFDQALAQRRQANPRYRLEAKVELPTYRLEQIMAQHLPSGQSIDFMSVDVEGLDLEVLQSNNWQLYRPTYVVAETLGRVGSLCTPFPLGNYLAEQGYDLVAHTMGTGIFWDRSE